MAQKVLTVSAGGVFTEAANAGELSFTPVNKAGDTGVGNLSMGALTATTGDFSGWVQLGENNAAGTYPSTGKYGFAFSRNFTSGGSELDIWNTNTIAPTGFVFRQMTGASTQVLAAISMGALTATTVKVTSAGGYISSDGSTGITTTVTTASLVGKTLTIKDGIITGFA